MNHTRACVVVAATLTALSTVAWSPPLLASPDRPTPRSGFGSAVVLEDGVAYVGRPGEYALFPIPSNQPGAVHLFEAEEGDGWVEAGVVRASDGAVGDGFGSTLDVSGTRMVVGAPGAAGGSGAAYLFVRGDEGWSEALRITRPDGSPDDGFAASVTLVAGRVLVGAPGADEGRGAVFVYDQSGVEVDRLSGSADDRRFGAALVGRDPHLLVGAPGPSPDLLGFGGQPDFAAGAGHLFENGPNGFTLVARLATEAGGAPEALGTAVALVDGEIVLSAPLAGAGAGVIRRFAPDGTGAWSHAGDLTIADIPQGAMLGMSMAGDGSTLLVGAPFLSVTILLERGPDDVWTESQRIRGEGPNTFFGTALAVEGDRALVGAPGEDLFSGASHVLARAGSGWREVQPLIDDAPGLPAVIGEETVECTDGEARGFDCEDVDLVAFLPVSALGGGRGIMVNDVWGWTDPDTGREYALVGRSDGMAFVDLGDPGSPVYLGELPRTEGTTINLWRDVKVYGNHAFIVADGAGAHGMQIFDLRQLRDVPVPPVTFDETAHYDEIHSAHNIVINEETGFAYVVGASSGGTTCGGGLHMVDIRDPTRPTFAGCFQDASTGLAGTGYSHDAQCVVYRGPDPDHQGKEICLGANENALSIADVTDKEHPVAIATAGYPNSAYFHQGWLSQDHRFFFANDEGDEVGGIVERTRTLVWDVEDLDDPILAREYLGTTATSDHNLYVRGELMYQSNYLSGLRILDVSDPANPVEVAFFDTVPLGEDAPGFAGSWSNYPYFESGLIVVTSMREGMFLLQKRERPTVF